MLPIGNKKDTRTRGSCNNLCRFSSFFLFCWQSLQHDINLVTLGRNETGCRLPGVVKKTILSSYSINNAAQAQYASCLEVFLMARNKAAAPKGRLFKEE